MVASTLIHVRRGGGSTKELRSRRFVQSCGPLSGHGKPRVDRGRRSTRAVKTLTHTACSAGLATCVIWAVATAGCRTTRTDWLQLAHLSEVHREQLRDVLPECRDCWRLVSLHWCDSGVRVRDRRIQEGVLVCEEHDLTSQYAFWCDPSRALAHEATETLYRVEEVEAEEFFRNLCLALKPLSACATGELPTLYAGDLRVPFDTEMLVAGPGWSVMIEAYSGRIDSIVAVGLGWAEYLWRNDLPPNASNAIGVINPFDVVGLGDLAAMAVNCFDTTCIVGYRWHEKDRYEQASENWDTDSSGIELGGSEVPSGSDGQP